MIFLTVNLTRRQRMVQHLPVLLREVIEIFSPRAGYHYLDATFGGGGHTRALLEADPSIRVTVLDCDPEACSRAVAMSKEYGDRLKCYNLSFDRLEEIPDQEFDGIIFDLGVSSYQLDTAARGFSFHRAAPLDMRMDPREGVAASEFLEKSTREELIKAVRDYGEEKQWRKVVDAILEARGSDALKVTTQLAEMVSKTVTPGARRGRKSHIHPATKTFQGLRISLNKELERLEEALPQAFKKLNPRGILIVIGFHSLEDRIVKRYFNRMAGRPEHRGDSLPQQARTVQATLLTRRPLRPSLKERDSNTRSRSARLRALRKNNTPTPK
jgi:16S rRNA (cytosine1402-N4)-methyltransferase